MIDIEKRPRDPFLCNAAVERAVIPRRRLRVRYFRPVDGRALKGEAPDSLVVATVSLRRPSTPEERLLPSRLSSRLTGTRQNRPAHRPAGSMFLRNYAAAT